VTVVGLWHLGAVIAAVLADCGCDVVAYDGDAAVIEGLREGRPAVDEPGLRELVTRVASAGSLRFAADPCEAVAEAEVVWIARDTPVGDDDIALPDVVIDEAVEVLTKTARGTLVIVSSQLPVGSVARLESRMRDRGRDDLAFAAIPENLRLGQAIETFRAPERFVVGVRDAGAAARVASLLERLGTQIEWMGIESAEMTKHAINAFLATSVAFINELAGICERVGADALEVSRGLRSERRIGPHAYLRPGEAFAGGTLARDLHFLADIAAEHDLPADLTRGVWASNDAHRRWPLRALRHELGELRGRRVGIWGITYKPGTDTLRRSAAVALCEWLSESGARVRAHDPAVHAFELADLELCETPLEAADGVDALVVCTRWPLYREQEAAEVLAAMAEPLVLDASGFLADTLGAVRGVRYRRVGAGA